MYIRIRSRKEKHFCRNGFQLSRTFSERTERGDGVRSHRQTQLAMGGAREQSEGERTVPIVISLRSKKREIERGQERKVR